MFSLIVNRSNCSYITGHTFVSCLRLSFVAELCRFRTSFFRVKLLCLFLAFFISLPIISNSAPGGSPQYQTLAQSFVHRRKRKSKQQRCSPNSSTTLSMTYLTSTSMWNPQAPMATKTFHSQAATLTNCSHSTHCQVTVALFRRPLSPPPINSPASLLSPGVLLKASGVCRKTPVLHHLRPSIRAPSPLTLSNLLLCLILISTLTHSHPPLLPDLQQLMGYPPPHCRLLPRRPARKFVRVVV